MHRFLRLTWGASGALLTLGVVGLLVASGGQGIFSPGPLSAQSRGGAPLGGFASHAAIGNQCSACHAAPWSGQSMADRCLACHLTVMDEIGSQQPLHGRLANAMRCSSCHMEHNGPRAALTDMSRFDHNAAAFQLTGKHRTTDCQSCHVNRVYRGTPRHCYECHAEPAFHHGRFGTDCAQCHSTDTWRGAVFAHSFPLNHGNKNGNQCTACHQSPNDFRSYTCYGCHRHNPSKTARTHAKAGILNIESCATCHPTARKHKDQPPKKGSRPPLGPAGL